MSYEEIQQALDQFAVAENKQLTETLLFPIREIARTGSVCYKWQSLVGVLLHQLRTILQSDAPSQKAAGEEEPSSVLGDATYEDSCTRLYSLLESFEGPPFTIQRICELLVQPHQHHKTKRKLLHALDKLLSVTTIVAEQSSPPSQAPEGKLSFHAGAVGGADSGAGSAGSSQLDRGMTGDIPMTENTVNGAAAKTAPVSPVASGAASSGANDEGAESMQTEPRPSADGLEDSAMAA